MTATDTISATGRRKEAVARIRLAPGTGEITVNGRPFEEYFPTISLQNNLLQPLQIADASQKYDIKVVATGGGISAQVGAITLAISRALVKGDAELRGALKEKGLLTRDSRMKERKKAGQPGARKRFQFSKR
ncbi:30S ribosomal protein S9 [soil metagenome]